MKDTDMVNIINKEITYKEICNALGCLELATKVITVDAGKFGPIPLSVCAKCAKKFVTT
jgi:hypothetical protein